MTQPTTDHQVQTGGSDANVVSDGAVLPLLAAIQRGYEEARASIIDPTSTPLNWVHDPAHPHPDTEAIDGDAVPAPVLHDAIPDDAIPDDAIPDDAIPHDATPHDAAPPAEATSAAPDHLAERPAPGEAPPRAHPADVLGIRRWWRAFWTPSDARR